MQTDTAWYLGIREEKQALFDPDPLETAGTGAIGGAALGGGLGALGGGMGALAGRNPLSALLSIPAGAIMGAVPGAALGGVHGGLGQAIRNRMG